MSLTNKQIAKQLMEDYWAGKYTLDVERHQKVYVIDGLTIRCGLTYGEVYACAEKFRKGLPYNGTTPMEHRGRKFAWPPKAPSTARVCSITTFLSFWDDGEEENAREYLRLFPRDKWPAKVLEILS